MMEGNWTQPTTAPKQPDVADEAVEEDVLPARAGRVHEYPWMEEPYPTVRARKLTAIDVFTGVVVVAFLLALFVALPLLLLQAL